MSLILKFNIASEDTYIVNTSTFTYNGIKFYLFVYVHLGYRLVLLHWNLNINLSFNDAQHYVILRLGMYRSGTIMC